MDRSMGLIAVVALLLALSVGACGGSSGGAPSSVLASSGPDSTAASSGLFGTYELTLAEGHETEAADVPPGRWLITLTPGEAYLDGPVDSHVALQPQELSEVRMVVPAALACPNNDPAPGKGIYDVHLTGDDLEFVKLRDPCGFRGYILSQTWHRVGD